MPAPRAIGVAHGVLPVAIDNGFLPVKPAGGAAALAPRIAYARPVRLSRGVVGQADVAGPVHRHGAGPAPLAIRRVGALLIDGEPAFARTQLVPAHARHAVRLQDRVRGQQRLAPVVITIDRIGTESFPQRGEGGDGNRGRRADAGTGIRKTPHDQALAAAARCQIDRQQPGRRHRRRAVGVGDMHRTEGASQIVAVQAGIGAAQGGVAFEGAHARSQVAPARRVEQHMAGVVGIRPHRQGRIGRPGVIERDAIARLGAGRVRCG